MSDDEMPGPATRSQRVNEAVLGRALEAWRQRMRGSRELAPRTDERGVRERALVRELLAYASDDRVDLSGGPGARAAIAPVRASDEPLALAAALYGASTPRERLDPHRLCEDLGQLREAVWQEIQRQDLPPEEQGTRILRFDRGLSVAIRAALIGGHSRSPSDAARLSEWVARALSECSKPR